ncbi:MAG: NAD-binding protein [Candidatus Diapherotrites archaeon]
MIKIVIAGDTTFAIELAKLSIKRGDSKVFLVIRDREKAISVGSEINAIVVNGDATNVKTLDELDLKTCDYFVAATESEKANVLSALYAKNAGAKNIFIRIEKPEAEELMKKLGFKPINPDVFAARYAELMVTRPAVADLVTPGIGEYDMIEVPAKETKLVNKKIGVAYGKNFAVIATYLDGNYNFSKEKKIEPNETLIVLVSAGKEKEAEREFM